MKITDADREAAASMVTKDHLAQAVRRGECDDLPALQVIARHREAAYLAGRESMREEAAQVAEDYLSGDDYDSRDCDIICATRIAAIPLNPE